MLSKDVTGSKFTCMLLLLPRWWLPFSAFGCVLTVPGWVRPAGQPALGAALYTLTWTRRRPREVVAHARRRRGLQEAETRRGAGSRPGASTPAGWTWSLAGRGRPSRFRGPDSPRFRLHILPLLSHRSAAVGAWSGRGGGAHQSPDRRLAAAVFVFTFLDAELRCEVTAICEPALRVDALCFASEALTSPGRVWALHQQ